MLNNENRYLFKFAWRSIQRNAGRSFFIGFSVSLAVMIAVWVVAFFDGLNSQIEKAVVNTNIGFYQLQESAYARSTDASTPAIYSDSVKEMISKLPISSASPELVLDGNISTPEGSAGLAVIGIKPELHKKFLPIYKKMLSGEFLTDEDDHSVIIGKELANLFKFQAGDQIVLNYQDIKGELRSELLTIKGIYNYNSKSFEKRYLYTNQKTWQNIFLGKVSELTLFNRISMMSENLHDEPQMRQLTSKSNLKFKTWKDLNPEMAVVLEFHDGMIRFFFIIIGITITMTILTPVRMLWQERFKELKMMSILGVSSSKFWKIGIFEVFQMILISSFGSSFLLFIVIGIQSRTGMDFRYLHDGMSIERAGIKMPGIIYPLLSSEQIFITFGFVIFVLSFSYIWSINRTIARLKAEL